MVKPIKQGQTVKIMTSMERLGFGVWWSVVDEQGHSEDARKYDGYVGEVVQVDAIPHITPSFYPAPPRQYIHRYLVELQTNKQRVWFLENMVERDDG